MTNNLIPSTSFVPPYQMCVLGLAGVGVYVANRVIAKAFPLGEVDMMIQNTVVQRWRRQICVVLNRIRDKDPEKFDFITNLMYDSAHLATLCLTAQAMYFPAPIVRRSDLRTIPFALRNDPFISLAVYTLFIHLFRKALYKNLPFQTPGLEIIRTFDDPRREF